MPASTPTSVPPRDEAIATLARYFAPNLIAQSKTKDIGEFASSRFYIPETGAPIQLMPHQHAILDYALHDDEPFTYGGTVIYSTIKKSGKTAIAAMVARYIAETWGTSNEIYSCANDLEQSRGRVYQRLLDSIELDPLYAKKVANNGWKIIERDAKYEPNRSVVKALSNDFRGEAGSNPTATFWTELWGYTSDASRRMWEELTPVPTRMRSVRWVETYAGFTDESDLLLELYKLGMSGRRLTHDDIDWPYADQPPIWINERARLFMYWDSGEVARRMPWQTDEYYQTQAATLRPAAYDRLHLNLWTSSTESFLPIEWWQHCKKPLPPPTPDEPIVMGVDAGVSNDCFALVGVSRVPPKVGADGKEDDSRHHDPAIRFYRVWYPQNGVPLDFSIMDREIRELCSKYNIVQIAYDAFQLHKMMQDMIHDAVAWCKPFSQSAQREIADKMLYDLVRDRRLVHNAGAEFEEHILSCAAKYNPKDDTRMRIVKKSNSQHVDLVVAASMGTFECLRLNL